LKQHKQLTVKIASLKGLEKNARLHSDAQIQQIQKSLERFGFLSPVVIDKKGTVIAGNGRLQAAKNLGLKEVPAIEAEGLSEADLRAYALVDNRLSETSEWDKEMLKHELDDLMLNLDMDLENVGFSAEEIEKLLNIGEIEPTNGGSGGRDLPSYTDNVRAPVYTPKGNKPKLSELFDLAKTNKLLSDIEKMEIPEDEKHFLRFSAYRHTAFNFTNIAEYYCHSSPEMQEAMENSALVIIDYNKAIENGFAKLTKTLAEAAND
jgi:hypothetical protein